jgi:hypothetical protein
MNQLYILINILAFIAIVVFANWLIIKSNGCSAFNPEVACTRSMRGE